MKVIKYKWKNYTVIRAWSEKGEEVAKKQSNDGTYSVYDDGRPAPEPMVTTENILDVLLGVTE